MWMPATVVVATRSGCVRAIFPIARYLVVEMETLPGKVGPLNLFTVDGDLAGVYQRFLDSLGGPVDIEVQEYLSVLTAVAAVGADGADPALVAQVAEVHSRRVRVVCDRAWDYLTTGETVAAYHPSFAEFLLSIDAARAREAHLGWVRAVVSDQHVFASLTDTQLRQLPWHLVQAVNLSLPAPPTALPPKPKHANSDGDCSTTPWMGGPACANVSGSWVRPTRT